MIQIRNILSTTTNATGNTIKDIVPGSTFQASIIGTGSLTAVVTIQCSLDGNWLNLGTITLNGTNSATDGFVSNGAWVMYRAISSGVIGTVSSLIVSMTEVT